MKKQVAMFAPLVLLLAACQDFNQPIGSSEFDPLRQPGAGMNQNLESAGGFRPGEFVTAAVNNTAFYINKPKEGANADKLLKQGTQMKVVNVGSEHLKVELDSGEVGFVPTVMISMNTANELIPVEGIYEVYPPLPNGAQSESLPILDPDGLPPGEAIPAIIDPDAPVDNTAPTLDAAPEIKPVEEPKPSEIKPAEEPKPEEKTEQQPKPADKKEEEAKPETEGATD